MIPTPINMLAGLAGSNPLVKTAFKYWWVAIPAGLAMYSLTKARGKVTTAGLISDFGVTFGPCISLIMLAEFVEQSNKPAFSPGPVKDAAFTVNAAPPVPQFASQG